MILAVEQSDSAAVECRWCNATAGLKKIGFSSSRTHGRRQRYLCNACGRSFSEKLSAEFLPFERRRVPVHKCFQFLQLLDSGVTLRAAAEIVGISRNTAVYLIRDSGYVRTCKTCGEPIPKGNRFLFCSDKCHVWTKRKQYVKANDFCETCGIFLPKWRKRFCSDECRPPRDYTPVPYRDPLFDATANLLRVQTAGDMTAHAEQALALAMSFSERNAAEYIGPCYEAIVDCAARGIANQHDVRSIAFDHIKRMWHETISHGTSLESAHDDTGFEPSTIVEGPAEIVPVMERQGALPWRCHRRRAVGRSIQGQQFGKWLALRPANFAARGQAVRHQWVCRCECGREGIVWQSWLTSGRSTECTSCRRGESVSLAPNLLLPESEVDWADFVDWLAKRLGMANGQVEHLRRVGVTVINETTEMRSDRRVIYLERRLRQARRDLRSGHPPPSLDYPVDHEPDRICPETGRLLVPLIPLEKYSSGFSGRFKRMFGGQRKKRYKPRRLTRA